MQPSVVWIGDAEKMFYKKVPKEEKEVIWSYKIYWVIGPFIHSFVHSFIYSFIHLVRS